MELAVGALSEVAGARGLDLNPSVPCCLLAASPPLLTAALDAAVVAAASRLWAPLGWQEQRQPQPRPSCDFGGWRGEGKKHQGDCRSAWGPEDAGDRERGREA